MTIFFKVEQHSLLSSRTDEWTANVRHCKLSPHNHRKFRQLVSCEANFIASFSNLNGTANVIALSKRKVNPYVKNTPAVF